MKELEHRNRDLEISTRAKDFYIQRLENEHGQYVQQLVGMSRYVGELESHVCNSAVCHEATARFGTVRKASVGFRKWTTQRGRGVLRKPGA